MNRLTDAQFSRGVTSGGSWTSPTQQGGFNVNTIDFDLNGNIQSLTRNSEGGVIDQLSYAYSGNQLQYVEDPAGWSGFANRHSGTTSDADYDYDLNGNMTKDRNKDIASITYNRLNLPEVDQIRRQLP